MQNVVDAVGGGEQGADEQAADAGPGTSSTSGSGGPGGTESGSVQAQALGCEGPQSLGGWGEPFAREVALESAER